LYQYDIYGARVNRLGQVIDQSGINISRAPNHQCAPSVAFDGTNYFVVWHDLRSDSSYDIYGARVDTTGVILDSVGFIISSAPKDQLYPVVAFDGSTYLVVWQDKRNGSDYDLYGARMTTSGVIIDSFTIQQPGDQIAPAVVHGPGNQIFVVYEGWTDYVGSHLVGTMRIWGKLLPVLEVEEEAGGRLSVECRLEVCPNPFSRKTDIRLQIADSRRKDIKLKIYDVSGRVVKQFNHLTIQPFSQVAWDGTDDRGAQLPAGIYFCRLETSEYSLTRKITRLK
jgi:hypothetical protein